MFECSLPLAADRAGKPPTLSSLADKKRVGSLRRTRRAIRCERRRRRILDVRAADLQEEMAEQRFSVPSAPTKTVATQRTSQRAERAIEYSAMREQLTKDLAQPGSRLVMSNAPAAARRTATMPKTTDKIKTRRLRRLQRSRT